MDDYPDYLAAAKAMWLMSRAPSARWEDLSTALRERLVSKATVGVDAALSDALTEENNDDKGEA